MVSGSRLRPGALAIGYVRAQGGTPEAAVAGSDVVTSAVAALANGMLAHADETDDVHSPSPPTRAARWCRRRWPWRSGGATAGRPCCARWCWATTWGRGSRWRWGPGG